MAASSYRVTAPFVYLKVRGTEGKPQINGFYEGAVVTDDQVDEESLLRHLDRGMVEEIASAPAKKSASAKLQASSDDKK